MELNLKKSNTKEVPKKEFEGRKKKKMHIKNKEQVLYKMNQYIH